MSISIRIRTIDQTESFLVNQLSEFRMKTIDLGNGAECTINDYGSKRWYLNNKLHRIDGPAVEYADGTKYWYFHGELHRTDGPAIEYANGTKFWYLNGERHRTDGPAIEYASGGKCWHINGKEYTEEEFDMVKEVLWMV
jgi:hypothetical protein